MILKRLFFLKGTYRGKQKKSLSDDFGAAMLVGDRMKDGTICFDVDLEKNVALFAPKGIFGGEATFDRQGEIPVQMNKQKEHGHSDWRRITDSEGETLAKVWDRVAPRKLQGDNAPWFWRSAASAPSPSPCCDTGYIRKRVGVGLINKLFDTGGVSEYTFRKHHVPVVRSGPALS